jgi:hypothetical protein
LLVPQEGRRALRRFVELDGEIGARSRRAGAERPAIGVQGFERHGGLVFGRVAGIDRRLADKDCDAVDGLHLVGLTIREGRAHDCSASGGLRDDDP